MRAARFSGLFHLFYEVWHHGIGFGTFVVIDVVHLLKDYKNLNVVVLFLFVFLLKNLLHCVIEVIKYSVC